MTMMLLKNFGMITLKDDISRAVVLGDKNGCGFKILLAIGKVRLIYRFQFQSIRYKPYFKILLN